MLQQRATSSRGKGPVRKGQCRRCLCKTNFGKADAYRSNTGLCRDCYRDVSALAEVRNKYARRP